MAKTTETTSTTQSTINTERVTTQSQVSPDDSLRSSTTSQTVAGGKKQVKCRYCDGEVLSEQNGRATRSASLWPKFQNICFAVTEIFEAISGNTKTIPRKQAIGGKCEACDNKGSYDDPSDSSDADQAAAEILKANEKKLQENLAKLGSSPGGSRLTRVAGADVLLVGHELNTADSVGVKQNVPGPGGGGTVGLDKSGEGRGGLDKGSKDHT